MGILFSITTHSVSAESMDESVHGELCGNTNCDGFEKEYDEILAQCPSSRACSRCSLKFCFICLQSKLDGHWQRGHLSAVCPVASR